MGRHASSAIVTRGISKQFGALKALDSIDLEIEAGELFGLLGPNGAGKTTLISVLSTIASPTSGSAQVCGYDVRTRQDEVRKSIGVVFQDPSLDEELTGEENLDFHGRLYGMDSQKRVDRTEDVLRLVDLSDRKQDLVKTYSGGMRRRLEIARGLMHYPKVLFLDEPTLGLDPQTRRRIWTYIRGLKHSYGMTIILTTHYMEEAEQLCDRIAIVDRGLIVALDTPTRLQESLGGDLLELEISSPDPGFLRALEDSSKVQEISLSESKMSLTVANGDSFLPELFELAVGMGVSVGSVSMRKPNLEDVFIKLTGREIRDDAAVEAKDRIRVYMAGRRR